jgi:hypothetical protein
MKYSKTGTDDAAAAFLAAQTAQQRRLDEAKTRLEYQLEQEAAWLRIIPQIAAFVDLALNSLKSDDFKAEKRAGLIDRLEYDIGCADYLRDRLSFARTMENQVRASTSTHPLYRDCPLDKVDADWVLNCFKDFFLKKAAESSEDEKRIIQQRADASYWLDRPHKASLANRSETAARSTEKELKSDGRPQISSVEVLPAQARGKRLSPKKDAVIAVLKQRGINSKAGVGREFKKLAAEIVPIDGYGADEHGVNALTTMLKRVADADFKTK